MKHRRNPRAERPRDPFYMCREFAYDFEVVQAAARCWFRASPTRVRMVADRAESFWEIAPVAMTGNFAMCEFGIEQWLADEAASCPENEPILSLYRAFVDARESGDYVTHEYILPTSALRLLETLGIRVPTQQAACIFYADDLCRRLIAGELIAEEAISALAAIPTLFHTIYRQTDDTQLAAALAGVQSLSRGLVPGTYAPATSPSCVASLARAEAERIRAALAPRVIRSDNPADWPSPFERPPHRPE